MPEDCKTITIPEAARLLGVSKVCAYAAAKRGELPCLKVGKRVVVLKEPFLKMLDAAA